MRGKIQIFSSEKLINFFLNLNVFFDINFNKIEDFQKLYDKKQLSILFLDNQSSFSEKTKNNICKHENLLSVCSDISVFEKFSLTKKGALISPVSVNKLIDIINNNINTSKQSFGNTELINHTLKNIEKNKSIDLTQAENQILLKLFNDKNIQKKHLERDVLEIKGDLNTSSIESHFIRIRKKLKIINSNFTISSKDKNVHLNLF